MIIGSMVFQWMRWQLKYKCICGEEFNLKDYRIHLMRYCVPSPSCEGSSFHWTRGHYYHAWHDRTDHKFYMLKDVK